MASPIAVIKEFGPVRVHDATGIPVSTLSRWLVAKRVPGKGPSHKWRLKQLEEADAKLRQESACA